MNRKQVEGVVERICVLWHVAGDRQTLADAWFRFLHDLDVDATHAVIDDLAVRSDYRFAPKVGELRRLVLMSSGTLTPPPSGMEAWADYQARLKAAHGGQPLPDVHPTVLATIQRLRGQALSTNGDREMFLATFAQQVAEWEMATFKVVR